MFLRYLPFVLFLGYMSTALSAQEDNANIATIAYNLALENVTAHWTPLLDGRAISFEEVNEGQSGISQSTTHILRLDSDGAEHLEQISDTNISNDETSLNWQSSILLDPTRYPQSAELIAETETTWVFSIPTQIHADVGDGEQEVDGAEVNNVLLSALVSELTISKLSPHIISQKIYSKQPFKPDSLVKVKEFKVKIDFAQAWSGGPWAAESISRILKGNYALFVSIDEFSVTRYQNFKVVNKSGEQ